MQNEQICKQEKEKLIGEIETQFSGRSDKWVGGYRKILTSTTCDAAGFSKFNRYITDLDRMERTYQARPQGSNLRLYDAGEVFDPKAAERYESSGNKNVKSDAIGKDMEAARAKLKKDGITPGTHEVGAAIAALPPTLANKAHVFEDITRMFLTKEKAAKIRNDKMRAKASQTAAGAAATRAAKAEKDEDEPFSNLDAKTKLGLPEVNAQIKDINKRIEQRSLKGFTTPPKLEKELRMLRGMKRIMNADKSLNIIQAEELFFQQEPQEAGPLTREETVTKEQVSQRAGLPGGGPLAPPAEIETEGVEPAFDVNAAILDIVKNLSKLSSKNRDLFERATKPGARPKAEQILAKLQRSIQAR